MILHNSRIRHKRTQVSGTTPTIGPSDDFTDDTWVENDIYPGEFFLDMGGQVGWVGYSGTTASVNTWFNADLTGSISAGEFLSSEQVGGNIIISYTGGSAINGGYVYEYYNFLWTAGSGDLVEDILLNPQANGIITEAMLLIQDTVTYTSFFGRLIDGGAGTPKRASGFYFNGTTGNEIGSSTFDTNNTFKQDDFTNITDGFWFYQNFGTKIVLRIGLSVGTVPNDTNVRLILKYRRLI